jgi:hypothetical protein
MNGIQKCFICILDGGKYFDDDTTAVTSYRGTPVCEKRDHMLRTLDLHLDPSTAENPA